MLKQIVVLLSLASVSFALLRCNETNPYQHKCYTIQVYDGSPTNVYDVAEFNHVNPIKVAELNGVDDAHEFVVGQAVIIPLDQCTPQPGQWGCYTVKDGDSLYSIAFTSDESLVRDVDELKKWNEDILYGSETIHVGMDLRLPVKPRWPTWETNYVVISWSGQDIDYIADQWGTTADNILTLNSDILGGNSTFNIGMDLIVPKLAEQTTAPNPCVEGDYWSCWTVEETLSLWNATLDYSVSNEMICVLNNVENCDLIYAGDVIAIPKLVQSAYEACIDKAGVWECQSNEFYYDQPAGDLSIIGINWNDYSYYGDDELFTKLFEYNADRLPTNPANQSFLSGVEYRIPFKSCVPNFVYTCVPFGSSIIDEVFSAAGDWFSGGFLLYFESNGYIDSWNNLLKDADLYKLYKVPKQTYVNAVYCQPFFYDDEDVCKDALNCPDCVTTPGENTCYKVGTGETIYSIAEQYGLDWSYLCQFNDMTVNCDCLQSENVYVKIPVLIEESEEEETDEEEEEEEEEATSIGAGNILGFYDPDSFDTATCTSTALTSLEPGQQVLIGFEGIVSWTSQTSCWIHFGNEVVYDIGYQGCVDSSDAYFVTATVPATYNYVLEDSKVINVFLEQWTTGGVTASTATEPIYFSANSTSSQITVNY